MPAGRTAISEVRSCDRHLERDRVWHDAQAVTHPLHGDRSDLLSLRLGVPIEPSLGGRKQDLERIDVLDVRCHGHHRDDARDDEALTMQVPCDGGVSSLRSLLDRLDDASIDVDGLSVQTPDLDDVFLSLTSHDEQKAATP
jgi:hypothetical protein